MSENVRLYTVEETCQIPCLPWILHGTIGYKEDGTFVEVGAYDGKTHSNTYALAQLGWRGLYIEPVPELFERCVGNHKDHPNIEVLNVAAGRREGVWPIFSHGDLHTMNRLKIEHIAGDDYDVESVQVRVLNRILHEYDPHTLELLVLDVEWMEHAVLEKFSIDYYSPTLVIVEMHELQDADMQWEVDWLNWFFTENDYCKIYTDRINTIFLRR